MSRGREEAGVVTKQTDLLKNNSLLYLHRIVINTLLLIHSFEM